jgi:hypothetical protein
LWSRSIDIWAKTHDRLDELLPNFTWVTEQLIYNWSKSGKQLSTASIDRAVGIPKNWYLQSETQAKQKRLGF